MKRVRCSAEHTIAMRINPHTIEIKCRHCGECVRIRATRRGVLIVEPMRKATPERARP